jgi:hypothetical protein
MGQASNLSDSYMVTNNRAKRSVSLLNTIWRNAQIAPETHVGSLVFWLTIGRVSFDKVEKMCPFYARNVQKMVSKIATTACRCMH